MSADAKVYNDQKGRVYDFGAGKFRSVTAVLDCLPQKEWGFAIQKHGEQNPEYEWEDYKDDATIVGTYLHFRIGAELAHEAGLPLPMFEPEEPLPEKTYYKKGVGYNRRDMYEISLTYWEDFKRDMRPKVVGTGVERLVYHPSGYAGRVDLVLSLDPQKNMNRKHLKIKDTITKDDVWLVDIKSSRKYDNSYAAQVWAYAQAWNYLFPFSLVNRMAVLRLNGETGWEFVETKGNKMIWESAMKAAAGKGALFK